MKKQKQNDSSRRSFLKNASLLGAGISASFISSCNNDQTKQEQEQKKSGSLNERSKDLMAKFSLKYPIFQAAPGGEALAEAVANSGGMGALSLGWFDPDSAYEAVVKLKKATQGNFYANYVLHFEPKSLDRALEAGCPAFQFSWGIPKAEIVKKIKANKAKLGIQVSSKLAAQKALEYTPDFLICQGLEAGGHVQATSYLDEILLAIIEVAGTVPVLVAGGVSTGHDLRNVINKGAAGAVLGSRFIATRESEFHTQYKQQLVNAGENSTVYTNCFTQGGWNAMHRVLRNTTFLNWEAAGCPLEGSKPGEKDVVATHVQFGDIVRYSPAPPIEAHTGKIEEMCMYAGEGVSKIKDIPTAKELIERLWKEFENKS